MKHFVLLFPRILSNTELKKDVGLFPKYFSKYFDKTDICYISDKKEDVLKKIKGIDYICFLRIKQFYTKGYKKYFQEVKFLFKMLFYVKNNKTITHLMIFHYTMTHLVFCYILKTFINKDIQIYLKLDMNENDSILLHKRLERRGNVKVLFQKKCIKKINLITTETERVFDQLSINNCFKNNLFLVPNGYDDEIYNDFDLTKKQKIISFVGRIGDYSKNNELMLKIFSKLDFKDWKVNLIGPVSEEFRIFAKTLFENNPKLNKHIFFIGNIDNSYDLNKYYAESSIFLLTSRYESSCLVLLEAAIYGNYIISTDVGAVRDLSSKENEFFCIIPNSSMNNQNEKEIENFVSSKLQMIINNDFVYTKKIQEQILYCRKHFLMSSIVQKKCFIDWYKKDI